MTVPGAHLARLGTDTVRLGLCGGDREPFAGSFRWCRRLVWARRRGSGREGERVAGGERRSQLCRSVAGDGVEPQRQ
jgi:hypothetical protein